ncbi:MAG TPA: DAHL domain-containing protein [Albitalea sp.]|uniref:DAHL domain-containing protein n=1 Tax=Piscinibacter sp. TaxID=1903157 RepID=UPI002ED049D2
MKVKARTTRALWALAGMALIAVLGMLIAKTRAIDFDAYNEILGMLRQLKQVDAEWNVDVLRTKTGLASNYDGVASPLPLIASLENALRGKTGEFWQDHAASRTRLIGLLDAYKTAMDRKTAAIESFKSQNAILRNSSRFLPVAATDLVEATRAGDLPATRKSLIEQSLNQLLADTMTYSMTPDQPLRERIDSGTRTIGELTADVAPEIQERVHTLTAHVGTVLKQQENVGRSLTQLAALPTAKAIDALSDAHAGEHEQLLTEQQIYRQALIAYAACLLLLLGFAAWRLFRYYQLLNRTNVALQQTNLHLKESQVHLVQAEKMSALGQMVAGIAHEINTPLAYVKGTFGVLHDQLSPMQALAAGSYQFTQQMRQPTRDNALLNSQLRSVERSAKSLVENGVLEEMATLLADGIHGIEQISEIVLNLKNFSRLDRAKVAEFSVQAGLDSTLLLARHLLKDKVEVRKEYGAVASITGSPSQINQVFLNIISNAVQAMPQREQPHVITLRTAMEDNQTVRVEIQDNGTGIPKDVVSKIFDPFFTTKPVGQGTGMGLSISYKIIHEHGGKISVDTEPGVGTVFTILLPVRPPESAAVEPAGGLLLAA